MLAWLLLAQAAAAFHPAPLTAANDRLCGLSHLEACADTNRLIDKPGFRRALDRFVGPGRAGWLYPDGTVRAQVVEVLHGPPDPPVETAPELLRFSACRAHSCPEKGAVFLTPRGVLKGVAVLHFRCDPRCHDDPALTVISAAEDRSRLEPLAARWARDALAQEAREFPALPHGGLALIQWRAAART